MHETGLYLLTRATGYIAAFQLDRHTGAIGPFTADLSIANAGGHAHTGQLDILEDLDLEVLEGIIEGESRRVAVVIAHMEKTQLGGGYRPVHGAYTILTAGTWLVGSSIQHLVIRPAGSGGNAQHFPTRAGDIGAGHISTDRIQFVALPLILCVGRQAQ